jgi:hypothetical protein
LSLASSVAPSSPAPSLPRGLLAMLSTTAMRRRFTRQAAIGRRGLSMTVRAASSAIPAGRCKSAPGMLAVHLLAARPVMLAVRLLAVRPVMLAVRLLAVHPVMLAVHLLAVRPGMLAVRLLAIRSPPACSASGHTILKPEPIWATMVSAIPVREPLLNVVLIWKADQYY